MKQKMLTLMGIKLDKKTTNENNQSMHDCGALWQRFQHEQIAEKIPSHHESAIYAVYFDYDGDHTQPFDYFIGCEVESTASLPEGLTQIQIPEAEYERIEAKGQIPDCIAQAWLDIWKSDLNRAFTYDYERYDERSADWSNAEIDIFISVK